MPFGLKEKTKLEALKVIRKVDSKVVTTKKEVLCYLTKGDSVLLTKGKDGYWQGIEDEIRSGESPQQAAARVVYSTAGLVLNNAPVFGELFYLFEKEPNENKQIFVILSNDFSGAEKVGAQIRWFNRQEALERHNSHSKNWFAMLLSLKRFKGRFYFDSPKNNALLKYSIEEL